MSAKPEKQKTSLQAPILEQIRQPLKFVRLAVKITTAALFVGIVWRWRQYRKALHLPSDIRPLEPKNIRTERDKYRCPCFSRPEQQEQVNHPRIAPNDVHTQSLLFQNASSCTLAPLRPGNIQQNEPAKSPLLQAQERREEGLSWLNNHSDPSTQKKGKVWRSLAGFWPGEVF